jgi:hypothetical protein
MWRLGSIFSSTERGDDNRDDSDNGDWSVFVVLVLILVAPLISIRYFITKENFVPISTNLAEVVL